MDGGIDGWMIDMDCWYGWMDVKLDGCILIWMDTCMNVKSIWMDGWLDAYTKQNYNYIHTGINTCEDI